MNLVALVRWQTLIGQSVVSREKGRGEAVTVHSFINYRYKLVIAQSYVEWLMTDDCFRTMP